MNKKYKVLIICCILFAIILFGVSAIVSFNSKDDNVTDQYDFETNAAATSNNISEDKKGNRVNTSDKIKKVHESDDVEISISSLTSSYSDRDKANFTFKVTNNSGKNMDNMGLEFEFIDSNGSILSSSVVMVTVSSGETTEVSQDTLFRIIDSYDYNFNLKEIYGY